jgi:hypothetical protein
VRGKNDMRGVANGCPVIYHARSYCSETLITWLSR